MTSIVDRYEYSDQAMILIKEKTLTDGSEVYDVVINYSKDRKSTVASHWVGFSCVDYEAALALVDALKEHTVGLYVGAL